MGTGLVLIGPATNYSAIVRPLQWLAVALVFLFFLRVIRAVWVEVRPAGPRPDSRARRRAERAPPPGRRDRRSLALRVVEPVTRSGQRFDVQDETTVGRSPACAIPTADDMYSSTVHARLFRERDHLWAEDLGSTNGTFVNSERIGRPTRLAKGDLLQVGGTVFEVVR